MSTKTKQTVEVAILYEDNTWDTQVIQIDHNVEVDLETSVAEWYSKEGCQIKRSVMAALYNDNPAEGFSDEPLLSESDRVDGFDES